VTRPDPTGGTSGSRATRLADFLGLERNIVVVSAATFVIGCGEQLWRRFFPKYLESLGAPVAAIGMFGSAQDFLDGVYQYPGGWIADRFGRRHALMLFVSLAALGYAVYWAMDSWPLAFVGLAFVMGWQAMASPALFAVVGDALPAHRRTMGFTVQAVLRRVPVVIAPTIGGLAVAAWGVQAGVRAGLLTSLCVAAVTLVILARIRIPIVRDEQRRTLRHVWESFPNPLRWLLASDVFVRTCEGMVDVFLVLFAVNVIGIDAPRFGALVAVQALTSMLVYVPAARIVSRTGKKPFVIGTFVAFALFPLAVVLASRAGSHAFAWLVLAFVVGGLREIGEPARKALIVDLAEPGMRGRVVGLYYLCRSLAIAPAAFIGGLLWRVSPEIPFYVASAIGAIGALVFAATVREEDAA
jgi:MFS family permease